MKNPCHLCNSWTPETGCSHYGADFYAWMPDAASVEGFKQSCDAADAEQQKNNEYRMQNYFNCVDDYSWGGLCDRAADEARNKRNRFKAIFEEQLEKGSYTEEFEMAVLTDLHTGEIVSERIVAGKFGECWIIGTGENVKFVGVAKKAATYEKKGYKVKTTVYRVEYYYAMGKTKNGYRVVSRLLETSLVDNMPHYQRTDQPFQLYTALNK